MTAPPDRTRPTPPSTDPSPVTASSTASRSTSSGTSSGTSRSSSAATTSRTASSGTSRSSSAATTSRTASSSTSWTAAQQVVTLDGLATAVRTCIRCPELAATRTQVVPGVFPAGARLAVLGEAPGAAEDERGEPFVGRSGQLLDTLLGEVGLDRAEVAVLNTLKCRPPGNRTPKRPESEACRGWTERQLALLAPTVVVALGLSAARWFLAPSGGPLVLGQVRGRFHDVLGTSLVPTYHPSAALRWGPQGEPRRLLREDLALAASLLEP